MSSETEGEDIDNVPLVRMEDVQPARTCDIDSDSDSQDGFHDEILDDSHFILDDSHDEMLETCIVDDSNFEECLVDDNDSNIGSMVSIKSEEVVECSEMIVPEVLDTLNAVKEDDQIDNTPMMERDSNSTIPKPLDSWPTLEILPGGVINLSDKINITCRTESKVIDYGDKIYACAKCPMSFRHLFNLVKHVKWHEEVAKQDKCKGKLTPIQKKLAELKKRSHELDENFKKQKIKVSGTNTSSGKRNYIIIPSRRNTNSGNVPKKPNRILIGKSDVTDIHGNHEKVQEIY